MSRPLRVSAATLALAMAALSADPPYKYYLTGNAADVQTRTTAGYALVGGGKDQDSVGKWFLSRTPTNPLVGKGLSRP